MAKTIWRELTLAFTFWLLGLFILNTWLHGFVALVLPLTVLEVIWVVNIGVWLWTKRK